MCKGLNNDYYIHFLADIDPPEWYTPGEGDDQQFYCWINLLTKEVWEALYDSNYRPNGKHQFTFLEWQNVTPTSSELVLIAKTRRIMGLDG